MALLREYWSIFKKRVTAINKITLILFIAVAVYAVFFSVITALRYYSLDTYAYDLGIYNQAFHTTLFDGKLLYYTADLTANPSGSLFGVHFSPIFLVILPLYAIYPNPVTLLAIQSLALSLGAVPLYFLAKNKLKSEKWALIIAILYLINPALQGINWYDFHPEAFLPALLLFALYFFEQKKMKSFLVSIVLTLMTLEFASFVVVFMTLYLFIKTQPWKRSKLDKGKLKWILLTILISFSWLILSLQIVHSFNSTVAPLTGEIYWREIGANSLLGVPGQIISHPGMVINAVSFDGIQKLSYAADSFGICSISACLGAFNCDLHSSLGVGLFDKQLCPILFLRGPISSFCVAVYFLRRRSRNAKNYASIQ